MLFVFYNRNPDYDIEKDCVVRAISTALDEDYYKTERMLEDVGFCYECEELEVGCYSYLLERVLGFDVYGGNGRKVSSIVEEYPDKTLLIRVPGHLTCAIYGNLYDTWDCSDETVDRFWIVE